MVSKTNYLQLFFIFLLLLVFFASSLAYGQEEELLLDNPEVYSGKQRTAVTFSHELHMDTYDCLECHHDYADGENILDEDELEEGNPGIRCTACHDADSETGPRRAYHRQCMGCHRKLRIDGLSTGPDLCGECHPK